MKYMIISDIHGGIYELNKVLDIYFKEHCTKLLILGDLFDYGFSITRDNIVNKLNSMKDSIVAVSGNCDNNIKDILFDMPYINKINLNNKTITLTHGHLYSKDYLSNLDTDIIFIGHSHIASIETINNKLFINPGSISKSRRGENSFTTIDEEKVTIRNLDNEILEEYSIWKLNEENIDYRWCNLDEFINLIKWYYDKNELKKILLKYIK